MQQATAGIDRVNPAEKSEKIMALVEISRRVTIEVVCSKDTLSFNQLKKHYSEGDLITLVAAYLRIIINESWNVDKGVTDMQLVIFAGEIVSIQYLTIEDVVCFASMAQKGRFGRLYNRVDLDVLNGMLDQYLEIRMEQYDRQRKVSPAGSSERISSVNGNNNFDRHMKEIERSYNDYHRERLNNYKKQFND